MVAQSDGTGTDVSFNNRSDALIDESGRRGNTDQLLDRLKVVMFLIIRELDVEPE
jgi:hypothetical protein